MRVFEHRIVGFNMEAVGPSVELLDEYGSSGWEVVERLWQEGSMIWLLMKREKQAGGKGKWV